MVKKIVFLVLDTDIVNNLEILTFKAEVSKIYEYGAIFLNSEGKFLGFL